MEKHTELPIFNESQERRLRDYFYHLDHQLGVDKKTSSRRSLAFSNKLGILHKPSSGLKVSVRVLVVGITSAFSIGILFSQALLMPTFVATRGYAFESADTILNPPQVLSIKVESPKQFAFELTNACLDADIEASLTNSSPRIQIVLHSLRANSQDQVALKKMLNLGNEANGDYTVVIGPLR